MIENKKIEECIAKKDILGKVFLFYGEEKYYRELYINKIKKIYPELVKGINYIVLDDKTVLNAISEANTPAFRI